MFCFSHEVRLVVKSTVRHFLFLPWFTSVENPIRCAVALLACALTVFPAAAQTVLKLNHTDTPSGARHVAAELFARQVAEQTKGRLRVLVFHSGQLGNDQQSIAMVAEGKLDFTLSATGSYAGINDTLNLMALPYLIDDYAHGWRVYDRSAWVREQYAKMPSKGLRVLATWEAGFRSFTTTFPLKSPADAKDKPMRVFSNEFVKRTVEAIGFKPVTLPIPEVYAAISSGKVMGQENPLDTIAALRFYEVAPHLTLTRHIYSPLPFAIAEKTWQKFSASDQAIVLEAARLAAEASRKKVIASEEVLLAQLVAKGTTVHQIDRTIFRNAVEPVYAFARTKYEVETVRLLAEVATMRSARTAGATPDK
jgi:TRAP-type transport system periplasmic protein